MGLPALRLEDRLRNCFQFHRGHVRSDPRPAAMAKESSCQSKTMGRACHEVGGLAPCRGIRYVFSVGRSRRENYRIGSD